MSLNITSNPITINLGSRRGEEMCVMKADHLMPAKEIKNALSATLVWITCCDREGNEVNRESNLIK